MHRVSDVNIREVIPLDPPTVIAQELPLTEASNDTVYTAREEVARVLRRTDERLLVVIGPCSLHDPKLAREYATRLLALRRELQDRLLILMRVYFEKPRTTIGWKGLINDPHLDGTTDIATGLRLARQLLLDITSMGLPAGSEMLDPISPQYLAELVSWAAIGARTTESQTHRELASGLSMPVGFKNGTDGNLQIACDAMSSAQHPHSFIGIDPRGYTAVFRTSGNPLSHVILRGGQRGPNYDVANVTLMTELLQKAKLNTSIMVDCSHANSSKQYERQEQVLHEVLAQRAAGNRNLIGVMIESNIHPGNQKHDPGKTDPAKLQYGVSITDACVGWEATERMLRYTYAQLGKG